MISLQTISHSASELRRVNGILVGDHNFEVPLNYNAPEKGSINVFAREICLAEGADKLPWAIFFQGGPGCESPRPTGANGWIGEILKTHRLLLLDQRGAGLSSPVLTQTLAAQGDPAAQAEYLTHFRADNIVRDSEAIRACLLKPEQKWTGVGQSYGGFCLLSYMSMHPEGLEGVIITGGVACVKRNIKDNYRQTYKKTREKNALYYHRYPEDIERTKEIVAYLQRNDVKLPSGGKLTDRRFQQLGMCFGGSGGFETLHYLIENAFVDGVNGKELSYTFLRQVDNSTGFESNPIFCVLHESIYTENYASNWAAEQLREEFPEFDTKADRFLFTGEMIAPQMLDDYTQLRPLKKVAEILAQKDDWDPLYDLEQLANNTVPVSAICYYDDMYVPIEWSEETAQHVGNFRIWTTNEWEHNGIGVDGPRIMKRLLQQLKEPAPYGKR